MALLTIAEASHQLGVSVHTLKRRLKRGELQGQQQATPQGFVWLVEIPDAIPKVDEGTPNGFHDAPVGTPDAIPDGTPNITPGEVHRMEEFLEALKDEITALRHQLEAKDSQIEARGREVQELHVLLQQAQAALPAPRESHHSWWRFWQRRAPSFP